MSDNTGAPTMTLREAVGVLIHHADLDENVAASRVVSWYADQFDRLPRELLDDPAAYVKNVERLVEAAQLLVTDVADYEAWARPCYALTQAKAALAALQPTKSTLSVSPRSTPPPPKVQ